MKSEIEIPSYVKKAMEEGNTTDDLIKMVWNRMGDDEKFANMLFHLAQEAENSAEEHKDTILHFNAQIAMKTVEKWHSMQR